MEFKKKEAEEATKQLHQKLNKNFQVSASNISLILETEEQEYSVEPEDVVKEREARHALRKEIFGAD